ncbi:helix-turn-helix transcriptional regulator [Thermoleptolyngbya sichuanensis A183]|jgi:transcriptional regulator with XRE-family HTH domain|uniref:Helix-turn-helix transcriptional regulator n=2 Tax=Thermoleptolyngbya TaxID=2303528 RepID=A0A6M8BJU4_9CYAN|nr:MULTISPECIES: helix-turn-helix transcriptional regulator [Thermoleptolyngbya]QKD83333.1 helix-turn-helix transcriptional regulator [Thermoleptolyngbya sichuanensis A183]WOB44814.1 helix-turn-helix transcriptional regulator [Thermoleptolyngbya oregonensis NK1-22]
MESFGKRLKQYREAASLTQRELAARLDVTITTVQNWEADRYLPRLTPQQTQLLCQTLGISLDDLAGES